MYCPNAKGMNWKGILQRVDIQEYDLQKEAAYNLSKWTKFSWCLPSLIKYNYSSALFSHSRPWPNLEKHWEKNFVGSKHVVGSPSDKDSFAKHKRD